MARKSKKRARRMPPLSFGDKLIYYSIFLLLLAVCLSLLFGALYLRRIIALQDEAVIAYAENGSFFWLAVPELTLFLMGLILLEQPFQDRKPIFGRKNFKYGPPSWPTVYPLFMRNKPYVYVSEREKKAKKRRITILTVVLLVSFIPFPWSLYGRDCLHSDGSIVQYSMFNSKSQEFTREEIAELTIESYRIRTSRRSCNSNQSIRMVFRTNTGQEYTFNQGAFNTSGQNGTRYRLESMINVKAQFHPDIIRYNGIEKLPFVITDQQLLTEEERLLYQLFGQA